MARRLVAAVMVMAAVVGSAQDKHFAVADSIQMSTFSLPSTNDPSARGLPSPDGRSVLVVTSRGVIATDEVESTLWLYQVDAIRKFLASAAGAPPRALALARVASNLSIPKTSAYAASISAVRWAPDSSSVYYLAEDSRGHRRLYRNSLHAHAQELTPSDVDVTGFDAVTKTVIYRGADPVVPKPMGEEINSDARDITGSSLISVLFPDWGRGMIVPSGSLRLGILRDTTHARQAVRWVTVPTVASAIATLALSPTGRSVIEALPARAVPEAWSAYRASTDAFKRSRPVKVAPGDSLGLYPYYPAQYFRRELESQQGVPLVNAPLAWSFGYPPAHTKASWSRDGRRVLVTGTFLPLDGVSPEERARRLYPCDAAVVELSSGEATCLAYSTYRRDSDGSAASRKILSDATFAAAGDAVVLKFVDALSPGRVEYWQRAQGGWRQEEAVPRSSDVVNGIPWSSRLTCSTLNGSWRMAWILPPRPPCRSPVPAWSCYRSTSDLTIR